MDRPVAWGRGGWLAHFVDVALLAAIVATGWAGMIAARINPRVKATPITPLVAALALAAVLPLWWRRIRPLSMVGAVAAVLVVSAAVDRRGLFGGQVVAEAVVLCFAIGEWSHRRKSASAVLALLFTLLAAGASKSGANALVVLTDGLAVVTLPAALGYSARVRRQYVAEVEQRLAVAERERDERARRAVADERTRIARELHDLVAHHVSLIGVQAAAARTALDRGPEQTRSALAGIEASSRAAVGEMRHLLEVMAPLPSNALPAPALSEEPRSRAPLPGLERLPDLVSRWRDAGLAVAATVVGDPSGLPPAISLCCFRIVEEALTNVVRHSRSSSVSVYVDLDTAHARVHVHDPGPAREPWPPPGVASGRGLVGMRERVKVFGGKITVGPSRTGGFDVDAEIPR